MNPSTSSGLVAVSQNATRDRRGSSSFARSHAATAAATTPAREKSPIPASRPNHTMSRAIAAGTSGCLMYGYQRPSIASARLMGNQVPSGSSSASGGR